MWLLLLLAVNRPIAIGEAIKLPTEARDMILAVDISGSMEEKDILVEGLVINQHIEEQDQ